jgi:hypothetical protein
MKYIRGLPRLRLGSVKVNKKRVLFKGLRTLEFLVGLLFLHIGIGGVMATTYGMELFRAMNLGGAVVEDIVNPITAFGMNGLIVSSGVIAVGLLLMRRLWLIPLRYPIRFLKRRGIKRPRGIFGSPVALYRSAVRFRNWFLAKVEYLQSESAKWKTTFNILKSPYSLLRAMGFSPQMAMTLLFAGSTVTTGVVANETVFADRSFSRGDPGVYLAPGDAPVSYVTDPEEEGYNTLRIDLGSTPVRAITIENVSVGTVFTGSALPSGQQNAVEVGGTASASTRLEVGHLIFEKSRCKKLELSDLQIHTLIIKGNASDGQSIAPSPGTSRMRAIGGGHHQASDMTHSGGTFDRVWISAPTSNVNGKVDKLTLSNLYTKGGPCVLTRMNVGTMEILLNEVGIGDGFATKEFTVATNVTAANLTVVDNVEVSISEPATS